MKKVGTGDEGLGTGAKKMVGIKENNPVPSAQCLVPKILTIAGSDSGGGAGIQADIKTILACGGYAASAITALTAQNTLGVHGVHGVPAEFVAQQVELVLADIGADVIKTGMLHNAEVIHAVCDVLKNYSSIPLVLDPVMIAKGGASLLEEDAIAALRERLIPRAFLLTPNIPEAEFLTGISILNVEQMIEAGSRLCADGAHAVLVKGGHLEGDEVFDVMVRSEGRRMRDEGREENEIMIFSSSRIETRHTHGTGCTLASAIATFLGRGFSLVESIEHARAYVRGALENAPGFGGGHGPLQHGWKMGLG